MEEFLRANFRLLVFISIVGNLLVILACILYRAVKGKRLVEIPEHEIKFSEKWASGCSHKSLLTRFGGAHNCLVVVLSSNALMVRTMFPFNFLPFGEMLDLEHYILRNKIKSINPDEGEGKGRVVIEFDSERGVRRFELTLRKRQEFLRAIS